MTTLYNSTDRTPPKNAREILKSSQASARNPSQTHGRLAVLPSFGTRRAEMAAPSAPEKCYTLALVISTACLLTFLKGEAFAWGLAQVHLTGTRVANGLGADLYPTIRVHGVCGLHCVCLQPVRHSVPVLLGLAARRAEKAAPSVFFVQRDTLAPWRVRTRLLALLEARAFSR